MCAPRTHRHFSEFGLLRTFVTAARETGPFRLKGLHIVVIDDRVKLRCKCNRMFREKASRVRDGAQFNCPDCYRLLTLSKEPKTRLCVGR